MRITTGATDIISPIDANREGDSLQILIVKEEASLWRVKISPLSLQMNVITSDERFTI